MNVSSSVEKSTVGYRDPPVGCKKPTGKSGLVASRLQLQSLSPNSKSLSPNSNRSSSSSNLTWTSGSGSTSTLGSDSTCSTASERGPSPSSREKSPIHIVRQLKIDTKATGASSVKVWKPQTRPGSPVSQGDSPKIGDSGAPAGQRGRLRSVSFEQVREGKAKGSNYALIKPGTFSHTKEEKGLEVDAIRTSEWLTKCCPQSYRIGRDHGDVGFDFYWKCSIQQSSRIGSIPNNGIAREATPPLMPTVIGSKPNNGIAREATPLQLAEVANKTVLKFGQLCGQSEESDEEESDEEERHDGDKGFMHYFEHYLNQFDCQEMELRRKT